MPYEPICIELLIVMDTTGSMGNNINSAKDQATAILNKFETDGDVSKLEVGVVAYRDYSDASSTYLTSTCPIGTINDAKNFISKLDANGGGDEPEAWDSSASEIERIWPNKASENIGRIVVWVADAPAHGPKYTGSKCPDHYPSKEGNLEPIMNRLVSNDVIFYFMLYPELSLNPEPMATSLLNWGTILELSDKARASTGLHFEVLLKQGIMKAIIQREYRAGLRKGMSEDEIAAAIVKSGIPYIEIDVSSNKNDVDLKESTMTAEKAKTFIPRSMKGHKSRAKEIGDKILGGTWMDNTSDPCAFLPGYDAMTDFELKNALKSHIWGYYSEPKRRSSRTPLDLKITPEFGGKLIQVKGRPSFIAIRRSVLNCLEHAPDWLGLLRLIGDRNHLIILEDRKPVFQEGRKGLLEVVANRRVHSKYPAFVPSAWPTNRPLTAVDTENTPINSVPGYPVDSCYDVLVIRPDVSCKDLPDGVIIPYDENHHDERNHDWHPRHPLESEPLQIPIGDEDMDDHHHDEFPDHRSGEYHQAWHKMKGCFCKILRAGVAHAKNCLQESGGKKNSKIIVEISLYSRMMGIETHPCWSSFTEEMMKLRKKYGPDFQWEVSFYN